MKLLQFKDVKIDGRFVYKNCLFIKGGESLANVVGSNQGQQFSGEEEVGIVVAEAKAPTENERNETTTGEDSDDG